MAVKFGCSKCAASDASSAQSSNTWTRVAQPESAANEYSTQPGSSARVASWMGAHVATASYMVAADARGRGVGRALVVDSLDWARESGYAAMQFNAVVATNTGAVKLYESLGFTVVGTVPRAHELPSGERVGLRIMHVDL